MSEITVNDGQILLFRENPKTEKAPLWAGKLRAMSGVGGTISLWERTARETGEIYLGGSIEPDETNTDVFHRPTVGDGKGDIALFSNDKAGNEARPDFRGRATMPDGSVQYLSIWKKTGKNGLYLAGQVQDEATIADLKDKEAVDAKASKAKAAGERKGGTGKEGDDAPEV